MRSISLFLRRNIRLLLGLAVVIFTVILISSFFTSKSQEPTQVTINNEKFHVEIAKTDKEKQIGLSNKEVLGANEGMLFLFDKPDYYSFWMKEMKFPIDIIFINGNKVTTIFSNALPPSGSEGNLTIYQPKEKSDKVLEVNAGLAKELNLKEGSSIDINNL